MNSSISPALAERLADSLASIDFSLGLNSCILIYKKATGEGKKPWTELNILLCPIKCTMLPKRSICDRSLLSSPLLSLYSLTPREASVARSFRCIFPRSSLTFSHTSRSAESVLLRENGRRTADTSNLNLSPRFHDFRLNGTLQSKAISMKSIREISSKNAGRSVSFDFNKRTAEDIK